MVNEDEIFKSKRKLRKYCEDDTDRNINNKKISDIWLVLNGEIYGTE